MRHRLPSLLTVAAALALAQVAATAGDGSVSTETVTTQLISRGDVVGKGSEFRGRVNRLVELAGKRQFDEAAIEAASLRRDFEATFDPALRPRCFLQRADMEAYQRSSDEAFEWVDWGYFQAVHMQMYLAAERRDFPAALAFARQLSVIAPVSAVTLTEMGYVQNQLRQSREALATYRLAVDVARQHESQRPILGTALRGVGFSLVELNRLEEAKRIFEESLQVDPGNKVALHELGYIDSLLRR